MANDLKQSVLKLDTVSTDDLKPGNREVKRVVWAGTNIVTGDECKIKDTKGNYIVHFVASVDKQCFDVLIGHSYEGIVLETLTHGTAYVTISI